MEAQGQIGLSVGPEVPLSHPGLEAGRDAPLSPLQHQLEILEAARHPHPRVHQEGGADRRDRLQAGRQTRDLPYHGLLDLLLAEVGRIGRGRVERPSRQQDQQRHGKGSNRR